VDPVDQQTGDAERLKNLEEAEAAVKRAREALTELEDALRVGAALKRSRESLKDLLNTLRLEKRFVQAQGLPVPLDGIAEQRLRSITPITQPLMLCSQVQRSGGTLLTRLFDGHPACFAHPSELRWGRLQKRLWPRCELPVSRPTDDGSERAGDWDDLLSQLDEGWPKRFAKDGYQKFSKWTEKEHPGELRSYPFVFDAALQRRIFSAVLDGHPPQSQRDVLNAYLTSLFNAWLDYQNLYRAPKKWITAFQPRVIMDDEKSLEGFFGDYPDGLLVTIVREPGAWLASFSRHVGGGSADELLDLWLESAQASLRAHRERPDRVVVLVFEDLVHNTTAVMRALADRMNIAFDDSLLEPTYNSMPVLSDSSHELATGIDPAVTRRHHDTLSAADHDAVAHKAAPAFREIRERFARV
jgi:hypothetical protein